ncbi:MAG TPA: SCO1664 family protein [Candidatus Baltobacteraceae bacterium]|nr:SCO1664 family protein [Candidatus Baltobacteraceae bacterium]
MEGRQAARGDVVSRLRAGDLALEGRLVNASNASFYGHVSGPAPDEAPVACVYKPVRGERPLGDFPDGTLAAREVAAYELSEAIGWAIVPPTVLRDGPFGPGMVQAWLESDPGVDPVELIRQGAAALRRMALFDAVANNADRKIGHLLPMADGHVFGVDHGICFAVEPKLRTVLWNWRGERFTAPERRVLTDLDGQLARALGQRLDELLAPEEVAATRRRIARLLRSGRFPQPDPDRPAVPWPPF